MKKNHQKWRILFRLDFLSILEQNPPLLVTKTWKTFIFGSFFFLDFLSKLEKPPLLVVFFSKVRISFRIDFQSSTFGVFFPPKSSTFWSLRPQQGARTLQNHFPACFFDGPHKSCKFRPDRRTLNFFFPRVPPLDIFRILIKCKKIGFFCFSRYGPHFLTRYSGLAQEQF